MKRLLKFLLYTIIVIIVIALGLVITLWSFSPGKADPIKDINGNQISGSISTIEKIEIGGDEQYLIIRGVDSTKPIMLFLHGGPGSPEFAFVKRFNQSIEEDYVMVYWEQRGAGKSYMAESSYEKLNLEQLIADTRELSIYLAKRFGKEKIFIMGHSWGSFLGIMTVNKYPDYTMPFWNRTGLDQLRESKFFNGITEHQTQGGKSQLIIN